MYNDRTNGDKKVKEQKSPCEENPERWISDANQQQQQQEQQQEER